MNKTVIKAQNISKLYTLGENTSGSFRDTFSNRVNKLKRGGSKESIDFWALKNMNFEIKEGEAVGIIGKNGAGKSTLLKILSRITKPTTGRLEIDGNLASLLEVGTGFHPELTGRENIYLNGTILGMSRQEVRSKFDEIVDFSGIEKFIDTPVKRYSSGMYVRLAFAVAAHLDPEILIIDEVLAVGDIEFQKRCLGKMKEVANSGRTILFVSHNMSAVTSLCTRAMIIEKGELTFDGSPEDGVKRYLYYGTRLNEHLKDLSDKSNHIGAMNVSFLNNIKLLNENDIPTYEFMMGGTMKVKIEFELKENVSNLEIGFAVVNLLNKKYATFIGDWEGLGTSYDKGKWSVICKIPTINLFAGEYAISPWLKRYGEFVDDQVEMAVKFNVLPNRINKGHTLLDRYPDQGLYQNSSWEIKG